MADPVVIFRTHSDIEASIVRGLLEAHGVMSIVASAVPHAVFPLTVNGLGEVRISVRADEAEEARHVVGDGAESVAKLADFDRSSADLTPEVAEVRGEPALDGLELICQALEMIADTVARLAFKSLVA